MRKFLKFLRVIKSFLMSFYLQRESLFVFLKYMKSQEILLVDEHLKLASKWLLKAQEYGDDDGYSRGFYLYKKSGWDKSYIETTGYIIPSLLNMYDFTKDESYKDSALKAGLWLLEVQKENGAYTDIDAQNELVFDTGQVMYGLVALYERDEVDAELKKRYKEAIYKASSWLCSVQDDDGSWRRYGYYAIAHSYYSRVSSILYKAGIILENEEFKNKASKHIKWVLSQQLQNGFFKALNFTPNEKKFVLHSIIYVLEGLFDYYIYTKDEDVLDALLKNAFILKELNTKRDMLLCSEYDENFECKNTQRCMTGLAQWSAMAFKLYSLSGDEDYLLSARKTLYYLKSKQFKEGENIIGSLPGSVPFWGFYAPFSAVNWGVKFYIDALLESTKYDISKLDESRLWIGESFKFEKEVVNDEFSQTSKKYIEVLNKYILKSKKTLDLGCGRGRYIEYFKNKFDSTDIYGIDPVFTNANNIKKGDAYSIDFDFKFDLIYTIEVLQHVKYMDIALKEIRDSLNDGGTLIICDRNTKSFKGFIKPFLELRGKWMYPYDSPFLEKWYGLEKWKFMLNNSGFDIQEIITFTNHSGKFGWMNRYNIIIARKKDE
jgi:SAM-dependent methyltransferase